MNRSLALAGLLGALAFAPAVTTSTPADAAMQCNAGFVKNGGNANSINCQRIQHYGSAAAAAAGNAFWKSKVGCNTGMYGATSAQVFIAGPTFVGRVKFVCLGIT